MAGSYNHVVTDDGRLRNARGINEMLECMSGDVVEAVEEMFGMIWFLAGGDADRVMRAEKRYMEGIEMSPGRQAPAR